MARMQGKTTTMTRMKMKKKLRDQVLPTQQRISPRRLLLNHRREKPWERGNQRRSFSKWKMMLNLRRQSLFQSVCTAINTLIITLLYL